MVNRPAAFTPKSGPEAFERLDHRALAEKFRLPHGKVYEKIGLPPHRLMHFSGAVIEKGRDDVLEAALAVLGSKRFALLPAIQSF